MGPHSNHEFILKNEITYWRFQKIQAIGVLFLIVLVIGLLGYVATAILGNTNAKITIIIAFAGIAFHFSDIYAAVLYYCNARKNCEMKKREYKRICTINGRGRP